MELLDYLKLRNDVSLSVASFNDIDNVILSYISYMNFSELFLENNNTYSIEEILEVFCEKYSLDEIRENGQFTARAPLLLEQMVKGERFGETRIGHYKDIFDEEEIKQFSAVTFFLPDGTNYIAFRGTDSTITGWKEDFLMSCMSDTEGAKEAVDYLNDVSSSIKGELMLGGHSKGGNFAIYASAFCNDKVKKRITKVYNNDGPGFRDEIIDTEEYKHTQLLTREETEDTNKPILKALNKVEKDIELSYFPFIVGTQDRVCDYVLMSENVSRMHAKFDKKDSKIFVKDLNSLNGTRVNKENIIGNEEKEIFNNDEVEIADIIFRLKI